MKDELFDMWHTNTRNPSYYDCWNAAWNACIGHSETKLEMPVSCKKCKIKRCEADMYSITCKLNLIWDYLSKGGNNANI